jgi:NAD(P)H-quinone oxidoreductase subunit 5
VYEPAIHEAALSLFAAIPLLYAAAAVVLPGMAGSRRAWKGGLVVAVATAVLAWVAAAAGIASGPAEPGTWSAQAPVRIDVLSGTMMALLASIVWAIVGFSRAYLDGEAGARQFLRWAFGVAASVSLLVAADHLLLLWTGWVAASLCLHQLLVFYPERPQALLAAHKKFLLSRLADLLLLASILLIGASAGTFSVGELARSLEGASMLPGDLVVATVLLALAVVVRSAQLPFHGWLIQVMEAPTPVSALLHAGVVNIGGFLVLRLAPLVGLSAPARWILILFGATTAVLAGLVMTTRVSAKVALAWSTCAQMGFMLLECGLGAWPLALLHLLAHSLYKAHAFLGAGRVVEHDLRARMAPAAPAWTWKASAAGLAVSALLAAGLATAAGLHADSDPTALVLTAIVAIGAAAGLADAFARRDRPLAAAGGIGAFATLAAYLVWHRAFEGMLAGGMPASPAPGAAAVLVPILFLGQYLVHSAARIRPQAALLRRLHAWLFHGLYLDEIFTRATLHLFPVKVRRTPRLPEADLAHAILREEVRA